MLGGCGERNPHYLQQCERTVIMEVSVKVPYTTRKKYYSGEKQKAIMKFSGIRMDLESVLKRMEPN